MILDQTASRILRPVTERMKADKERAVIVGYGNAKFPSRGPTLQLLKAIIRRMREMRMRGIVALLVFIDEFRMTVTCHRCHGPTTDERVSRTRRFRDCQACGTEKAPKRWGRDSNAALNILRLLSALLRGEERPEAFRRPVNVEGG